MRADHQGYAWLCLARRSLRRLPCPRPGGPVSLPVSGLSGALGGRALFLGGAGAAAAGAVLRRGAGVRLVIGEWHGAPVRLRVTRHWTGPGDGHGRLLACRAEVIADGRGAAGRPRRQWLWLPAPDGTVTAAGPGETMQGLPGGPAGSPGRGGRGRGGAACVAGSGGPVPMRLAHWWRRGWRAASPIHGSPPHAGSAMASRQRCTSGMAAAPSPTAAATRLIDPARTSPAANTPGRLVSSGSGGRPRRQRPPPSPGRSGPVRMKPHWSRATLSPSHSARGCQPMRTNKASAGTFRRVPDSVSCSTSDSR